MIRKLKILLFIISLLPCTISGQQVFDTTISIDADNTNHEGATSITKFNDGYAIGGRYINRDTGEAFDSSFVSLVDEYSRTYCSKRFASDSTHFQFYNLDVEQHNDYLVNLYTSRNSNTAENDFWATPFLSVYDVKTNTFFETVPIIKDNFFVARGLLISDSFLYIHGESEKDVDGVNKALIARFDLNIEAWQDTIEAIDYLLIEGEEHDHKIMDASLLSDGSILAIMHEYAPSYYAAMSLCKVSENLTLEWKKTYTEVGLNNFLSTTESKYNPQHFYVTGSINTQRMISKFDFSGNIIWEKLYPIENEDFSYFRDIYEDNRL